MASHQFVCQWVTGEKHFDVCDLKILKLSAEQKAEQIR